MLNLENSGSDTPVFRTPAYLATGRGGDRLALRIVEMIEDGGVGGDYRSCPG